MQNIDKVALALAGLILLGGIVWSFLGDDPGTKLAAQIEGFADQISEISGEQIGVTLETPPNPADTVREKFRIANSDDLPEWVFYRRPAEYKVKLVLEQKPPVMTGGEVCSVEVVREAGDPNRTYHRVKGVRGGAERADIIAQFVEVMSEGSEWLKVADAGVGERGSVFEIVVENDLVPGTSYSYRVVTRASTKNSIDFEGAGPQKTVQSDPSDPVLLPLDEGWEVSAIQPGGLVGGQVQEGRATIKRLTWDWAKMKVKQEPMFAVEGSDTNLFDTGFTLHQIRIDMDPTGVILLRENPRDRMTLQQGIKAPPLAPDGWESDSPACTGKEEAGEESAEAPPEDTGTPEETSGTDDDSGGGGLFGDD